MSASAKGKRSYWDITDKPPPAVLAKRRLAAAVRELSGLTATSDAPEEVLSEMAAGAERLVASLSVFPTRTFRDAFATCKTEEDFLPSPIDPS